MDKKGRLIIYLCFFVSGIAGLIYEVVWAKYLALILGNTTYAHTLVLATFMGGLALGSFLLGRLADKIEDRLSFYAWVEIAIALFGIATPLLFSFSRSMYLAAVGNASLNPAFVVIIKFLTSSLIVLLPAILMGGTLPILSRFMVRSLSVRGRTVARLYYINSFGAVVGTVLAGFYLIYRLGFANSIAVAASLNFIAGVIVLALRRFRVLVPRPEPAQQKRPVEEDMSRAAAIHPPSIINIALIGIFFSGCVAMLYELVWIRLLSVVFGSSTYSFALMLAAFITGITLGAFLISKFMPDEKYAFPVFGICEILIGLALLFSLYFYERLPYVFMRLVSVFVRTPQTFPLYSGAKFLLAFLLMLPATVFLGMTLPLVSKVASNKMQGLGRSIGGVFAVNTAGNIIGVLITGLLLIQALGLKHTLELGIVINISIGIAVLAASGVFRLRYKAAALCICIVVFSVYKIIIPEWNNAYFASQPFRFGPRHGTYRDFTKISEDVDVLFHKDGSNATVAVLKLFGPERLSLFINGKADASTGSDMPTQILSAQLPLLMKPDAGDVLVVGLGSGVTCGSALTHPIKSLDLIEISPAVLEASIHFAPFNYNALADKRLEVHLEDAKTFLHRTKKRYDVIINEPSTPWISGVGSLFSAEYFSSCLSRLREDGLMVQFTNGYEMDDNTFMLILRTFVSVFPEAVMWNTGAGDVILIGSAKPITMDFDKADERMSLPPVKADLARIKLHDVFTLLALQLSSKQTLEATLAKEGSINSDYFPILEYMAPLALYMQSRITNTLINLDERSLPLPKGGLIIEKYTKARALTGNNLRNLFGYISAYKPYNEQLFFPLVKLWRTYYPDDEGVSIAHASYNVDALESSIETFENIIKEDPSFENLDQYAALLMKRYKALRSFLLPAIYAETIDGLKRCAELSDGWKGKAVAYYLLGDVYSGIGDDEAAGEYFAKSRKAAPSPEAASALGINFK